MNIRRLGSMFGAIGVLGTVAVTVTLPFNRSGIAFSAASSTQQVTFAPTQDAYVTQASPSSNFGTATQLNVAGSPKQNSYLLFNVSGLTGTVTAAQLTLNATTPGSGFGLHLGKNNTWGETTITYANAPGFGAGVYHTTAFGTGPVSIAASSFVTGIGLYTLVITTGSTTPIRFSSREAGASAAPQLVITETVPPTPTPTITPTPTVTPGQKPIKHIVVFFQENHSFDSVLGAYCAATTRTMPCDGATSGKLPNGSTIPLSTPPDIVPPGDYNTASQVTAIDGGKMDGFGNLANCSQSKSYQCYSSYRPSQIPNLAALATKFAVSDRTFEGYIVPSWSGHMELATGTLDGFIGQNPLYISNQTPPPPPPGKGWGCDSNSDSAWLAPGTSTPIQVPSCVPDPSLNPSVYPHGGAFTSTPVKHVDTIMDRMDAAGLSWRIYNSEYLWAVCPTFADCLDTSQKANMVGTNQVLTDAANGTLANFSMLLPSGPTGGTSQHNGSSMAKGDNWIAQVISAIENGPEWSSTAIFITYDDNGGFYDHVAPPLSSLGIRLPMVIISPYAKSGYTDSNTATYGSILAYTEHTFGIPSLGQNDVGAYDFSNTFDYSQTPLTGVRLTEHPISLAEQQYLAAHPEDPNAPT